MEISFRFIEHFLSLFYPNLCLCCGRNISLNKEYICLSCKYSLPKTDHHLMKENPFTERFWGRVRLESAAAMCHFVKGGSIQKLIHNLKYEAKQDIGVKMGEEYGRNLKDSLFFKSVEVIVPIPLHPKKERKRGYNQSDLFAKGLASGMKLPWLKDGLHRTKFTETQTAKSRMERFDNVFGAFELGNGPQLMGKHVLLADDVITTGATLEACALKILELPTTKVSLAAIAIAEI